MHAAKVEVTFWGYVGDVRGNATFLAELEDLGRGFRVVDSGQYHVDIVKVRWLKFAVYVGYLIAGDTVCDFVVKAGAGADDGDFGISIEDIEDTAGSDLRYGQFAIPRKSEEG